MRAHGDIKGGAVDVHAPCNVARRLVDHNDERGSRREQHTRGDG
jgi:hypothetical protein